MGIKSLTVALFTVATTAQNAVQISPNASVAEARGSLSQVIAPSFAGFGIEATNLFSFAGGRHANQLSLNLLQNLANATGVPPHIRIGGNTQDTSVYNKDFGGDFILENPQPLGSGQVPWDTFIFGPRYFESLNRLGTPVTYGLSLAYDFANWTDQIVATADAARSMLNQTTLVSFEVGNEPNLYGQNGFRNASWSGQLYSQEWLSRVDAVYEQVLRPQGISSTFFEPTCTSSTIDNGFAISQLVQQNGILTQANNTGPYVSTWNQHDYYYYANISDYGLILDELMDLSTTPLQFEAWAEQVQEAFSTGLPFALREYASFGPIGQQGLTDTFGAALWNLYVITFDCRFVLRTVCTNSHG